MSLETLPAHLDELKVMSADAWRRVIDAEPHSAARWMREAACLGHPDAQTVLGQWLLDGHGLARNPSEALGCFLRAGAQGHVMGMNMAGRCFENGWGAEVDAFAAANWYRQAAQKGLDAGMYNYANVLAAGKGVKKDLTAALEWYRRAAKLGHAKSMTKIGHFYEDGKVVIRNSDTAFQWFEQGARGGDFRGQFNYASMLAARGRLDEALDWLKKVPLTATVGYKRLAGAQLLQSPDPEFQAIGQVMLDSVAEMAV